jgi:hypothetical protein
MDQKTPQGSTHEASRVGPVNRSARKPQVQVQTDVSDSENTSATVVQTRVKRMKWSSDLNKFIMSSYYKCTQLETDCTLWRKKVYQMFVEKYPNLDVTEQRVADQKRAIERNSLLAKGIIDGIKAEVERELKSNGDAPNEDTHQEEEPETPESYVNRQEDTDNSEEMDDGMQEQYLRAQAEFLDHPVLNRPRIPRIRENRKARDAIAAVNKCLENDFQKNGEDAKDLYGRIYCAAVAVVRTLGMKLDNEQIDGRPQKPSSKPKWMIRLENEVTELRADLNRIIAASGKENTSRRAKNKYERLKKKYKIHAKYENANTEVNEIQDTVKQKLVAKAAKLKTYKKTYQRKTDNVQFQQNQQRFYRNMTGEADQANEIPTKEEVTEFWTGIWSNKVEHRSEAYWIQEVEQKMMQTQPMQDEPVTEAQLKVVIRRLKNWKAPGLDKIQNYWYKKLTATHRVLLVKINEYLNNPNSVPEFFTQGVTYMKPKKGDTRNPAKYRPIACLPTAYKIFTACLTIKIREHCTSKGIIYEEQNGCRNKAYGCKEQLVIDQLIMEQARTSNRKLCTAYIDYQKAYDSVPHSWLVKSLEIYKVDSKIIKCLRSMMLKWSTIIQVRGQKEVVNTEPIRIRRGIYQGDSLSPLWFCLALNPLSMLLRESTIGFNIRNNRRVTYTLNHLLYMDDLKLYAPTRDKINQLVQIVQAYSTDIRMSFGFEKCRILDTNKVVPETGKENEENPQKDQIEDMKPHELYRYLGTEQNRGTEHKIMKEELKRKFVGRLKQIMKTGLNSRNMVKAINTYAVPVLTYSFGIIKWNSTEIEDLQRRVRVLMTRNKMLHPKSAVERLIITRNSGGRGVTNLQWIHGKQVANIRKYFQKKKSSSKMHLAIVEADKKLTAVGLKDQEQGTGEQWRKEAHNVDLIEQWKRKTLHGRYPVELEQDGVDRKASLMWLTDGYLYPETEGFMIAIQDGVIKTRNYVKYIIRDDTMQEDKCRMCGKTGETIQHIISACESLVTDEYKTRHDSVAKVVHMAIIKKWRIQAEIRPYWEYEPLRVIENRETMLLWDRTVYTNKTVAHNRPDIVLKDKERNMTYLIDIAVPGTNNMANTMQNKMNKYKELAEEIQRVWKTRTRIMPIVVTATGVIPKKTVENLRELGGEKTEIRAMQKAVILHTTRIVRKVIGEE